MRAPVLALIALFVVGCENKTEAPSATVQSGIDSAVGDVRAAEKAAARAPVAARPTGGGAEAG